MLSFAFARLASVAFNAIKSASLTFVNSISAVKSWPLSASSINICLVSENAFVVTKVTVKSVLPEFSISPLVSAESDAINFSPELNWPTTFVKRTLWPSALLVSISKSKPVAPEVLPVIFTPVECVAVNNGLGVSLKVKTVNVRMSNKCAL